jgi:hypothetical protein
VEWLAVEMEEHHKYQMPNAGSYYERTIIFLELIAKAL